jgi:hypothetical protein
VPEGLIPALPELLPLTRMLPLLQALPVGVVELQALTVALPLPLKALLAERLAVEQALAQEEALPLLQKVERKAGLSVGRELAVPKAPGPPGALLEGLGLLEGRGELLLELLTQLEAEGLALLLALPEALPAAAAPRLAAAAAPALGLLRPERLAGCSEAGRCSPGGESGSQCRRWAAH